MPSGSASGSLPAVQGDNPSDFGFNLADFLPDRIRRFDFKGLVFT